MLFARSFVRGPTSVYDSKFFYVLFVYYIVWQLSNMYARMLSSAIGLRLSILVAIHVIFAALLFNRTGYECTVFVMGLLYLVLSLIHI